MASPDIVDECLCVLLNNFGKVPRNDMISVFSEFYTENEIASAKKVLMEIAESITPNIADLSKIKARIGDGKLRREAEDIVAIYTMIDNRKHVMPKVFAADTSRIPTFKEMELCKVTSSISELTAKVAERSASLTKATDNSDTIATQAAVIEVLTQQQQGQTDNQDVTTCNPALPLSASAQVPLRPNNTATHVSNPWIQVGRGGRPIDPMSRPSYAASLMVAQAGPKPTERPRRRITGTKTTNNKIVASSSSASKTWHVFIGHLNKDTNETQLKEYLEDNGISVVEISQIKATKTWHEKSSAFRVSIALKDKDSIMNCDIWPDNVEVRDWFFKAK
jgi:hypothetical protein